MLTEHLQIFAEYSRKLDAGEFTDTDFLYLQRLEPEIIQAYQEKTYSRYEYEAIIRLYHIFMDKGREFLRIGG